MYIVFLKNVHLFGRCTFLKNTCLHFVDKSIRFFVVFELVLLENVIEQLCGRSETEITLGGAAGDETPCGGGVGEWGEGSWDTLGGVVSC